MEYKPGVDIYRGEKFIDNYKIFTNNMLDTLKKHNNLLISKEKLHKALSLFYFNKTHKKLFDKRRRTSTSSEEYTYAVQLLNEYITSLTGFAVIFRDLASETASCTCVILENINGIGR